MPKPLPVAVLEAKKESEDPLKGMQQAKGYADCRRHDVKYVFATNGHRYGEFDKFTKLQDGPFPFPDFPNHSDLTARFAGDTGIDIYTPEAAMLFMADSPAYPLSRYYQDAAIRAAFEKIIRCRQKGEHAHVLLSMATGSGKTIIAANLLWRLHEAECLPKPALFLCDRDELREQAYNRLKAVFGDNARIVETRHGKTPPKMPASISPPIKPLGWMTRRKRLPVFSPSIMLKMPSASLSLMSVTGQPGADGPKFSNAIPMPYILV
jgi:type I restriction enzyme R subunit